MSTQKTLSKGTLSLRFMQNAQRANQEKEVELDKAEVKDDGEWEVGQDVREAWGIGSSQTASQVTFEASYLPFVFRSSSPSDPSSNLETGSSEAGVPPKGRRRFKHGLEVEVEDQAPAPSVPNGQSSQTSSQLKPARLKSISGSSIPDAAKNAKAPKGSGPTARQSIFNTTGTGVDLRSKDANNSTAAQGEPVFMKPSGVDEPRGSKRAHAANLGSSPPSPAGPAAVKREREKSGGQLDDESKPRKKKKKRIVTID